MTVDGIRGINAGFIQTLGALSRERESFSSLGGSSSVNLSSSLRIGARLFADSVGHLNDLISFTNISREKLTELSAVVDKLYNLAERASRAGAGRQSRSQFNSQFNRLAKDFEKIIKDAEVGGANLLTKGGLAELFTKVGLDVESSAKLASLFDNFRTTKNNDRLASSEIKNTSRLNLPSIVTPSVTTNQIELSEISAGFNEAFSFNGGALFVRSNSVYRLDSDGSESLLLDGGAYAYSDVKLKAVSASGAFVIETKNDLLEDPFGEYDLPSQLYQFSSGGTLAGAISNTVLDLENESVQYSSVRFTENGVFFLSEIREIDDQQINVRQTIFRSYEGETTALGRGSFSPGVTLEAGDEPYSVTLGDLNGDGILDMVTADRSSTTASIILGNGDGTFQPRTTVTTGDEPNSVTLGDLNGDGILDMVTADFGSNTASILLGNGDGTFQARTTVATGSNPYSVTLGDLNGDGILDMVIADESDNTASIMLGNGDGTFQARTTVATGSQPFSVTLGDLNGDGILDMVTADYGNNTASIMLGNGDGTFQARTTVATENGPNSVTLGDLNGDGILDMVTADRFSNTASIMLGNGDGTFQARTTVATGVSPISVTLGDLNGDGILDMVTADESDSTASIMLGNGDGTFQARTTVANGSSPASVTLGDLNGDGVLDFVTAGGSSNATVFLARTEFERSYSYNDGDPEPKRIYSLQVNQAGDSILKIEKGEDLFISASLYSFSGLEEEVEFSTALFQDLGPEAIKGFTLLNNGKVLIQAQGDTSDELYLYSKDSEELIQLFGSAENFLFDNLQSNGSGYFAFTDQASGLIKLYQLDGDSVDLITEYQAPSASHKLHFGDSQNPPKLWVEMLGESRSLLEFISTESVQPGSTVKLSLTNEELTAKIFSSSLTLENRAHAFKIAHDLKELKKQIRSNIDNLDEATKLIGKGLEAAREAGFAFLELSQSLKNVSDAESLAEIIRSRLRQKGGALALGGFDLASMAIAAYGLSKAGDRG